jgi:Tfp pilus assembly protein PilV
MIEVAAAVLILAVGLLGASMSGVRCAELQRSTQDYVQAHHAAREVVERLRNGDLAARFQELAATPDFDSGALRVEVRFPAALLVDSLGGPPPATARFRDLDADGQVDMDVASTDPQSLLPLQVTVRRAGMELQVATLVSER